MKIVANSIHSIRLLQIACNSNNNSNYFGCDTKTFEQITQVFPVFLEIMPYLNSLAELIKSFKLDMKEFALYAALLAYSSGKYSNYLNSLNLIYYLTNGNHSWQRAYSRQKLLWIELGNVQDFIGVHEVEEKRKRVV